MSDVSYDSSICYNINHFINNYIMLCFNAEYCTS